MNVSPGGQQQPRQLNPQILMATLLVIAVSRDIESLVPQAMRVGSVTTTENRVRNWQTSLQTAVSQLNQVPAPLIFPPPAFVTFINGAVRQINQALATLASIPIVAPQIFPPQPGQATISLETLQFLLNDLQEATALLIRALQTA
jgi:hypothetical protein